MLIFQKRFYQRVFFCWHFAESTLFAFVPDLRLDQRVSGADIVRICDMQEGAQIVVLGLPDAVAIR